MSNFMSYEDATTVLTSYANAIKSSGGGGLLPHLIIISETGESVVKAVKGQTEIIATETSTGHYECNVPEFGTWTIHAVLNGDDAIVNLVVDTVKVYTVDDSHFHADITVAYPSGGTCYCSKSGETTLYATGSPYTFTVHSAGAWTITAVAYGKTFTQTINISESGQTVYTNIPDGTTITPTDDIQILLACAGIGDSEIASLAELLDDTSTLSAVINSNNAVDYMVRSTTWAVSVSVPVMTSNTTPKGVASAISEISSTRAAWKAFNNASAAYDDCWQASSLGVGGYIQYRFEEPVAISKVKFKVLPDAGDISDYLSSYTVKASNDGSTWADIYSGSVSKTGLSKTFVTQSFENDTEYSYWRFVETAFYDDANPRCTMAEIQFLHEGLCDNSTAMTYIGLNNYASNTLLADATWCEAICNSEYFESVLNVKVPTMTDNTHPYGEVTASAVSTATPGAASWKAFDDDSATYWNGGGGQYPNNYCRYTFPTSKKMYLIKYSFAGGYSSTFSYTAKFQTSDDGVTWTDATDTYTLAFNGFETKTGNVILNGNAKRGYGIQILSCNNSGAYSFGVNELQFYGREDV